MPIELQYKEFRFDHVKAAGGDGSIFEGYCAAFNNVDSYGDVIMPGAFAKTLPDFLTAGQILFEHRELIGKPLDAREDPKGLFVRGKISDTACGRDVKTLIADGVLRKMSIGYQTVQGRPAVLAEIQAHWAKVGYTPSAEDARNIERNAGYLKFLIEIQLFEASPVGFPANTRADITGSKTLRLSEIKSLIVDFKAGRTLSAANRGRLAQHAESLRSVSRDLDALLEQTALPEADPATDTDPDQAGADQAPPAAPAPIATPATDPMKAHVATLRKALTLISLDPHFRRNDPR